MRALFIFLGLLATGSAVWVSLLLSPFSDDHRVLPDQMQIFNGVSGPSDLSTVLPLSPTPVSRYQAGAQSRLAVLLTDPASNWLRLAHGLKTIGVPFLLTKDYRQALAHRVVLVYPMISGRVLSSEALEALAAFPRNGGTLIGVNVLGGGLNEVFGFKEIQSSGRHLELRLNQLSPLLAQFTEPKEQVLRLGDRQKGGEPVGSHSYLDPKEAPLACTTTGHRRLFSDRTARVAPSPSVSISGTCWRRGTTYGEEGIAESYDNRFDPLLDVVLRMLKEIYRTSEPNAVTLGTVPYHRSLSVLLTHDIDASIAMANSLRYAEFERSQGITGTYFIQTKYIRDYNDDIFFNRSVNWAWS
jgi:hypothetical protein